MEKIYYSSSEFVSSGHPDRVADNLAAILIDKIQKQDRWNSHAAVEVFLTHDQVIFSGEVTTTLNISSDLLRDVVEQGFYLSGYRNEARKFWNKQEVALPEDLVIVNLLRAQSPDIALGTTSKSDESGWNDQGIMFSSSENTNSKRQGFAMFLAQELSDRLLQHSVTSVERSAHTGEDRDKILGPDNKVVITIKTEEDGMTPVALTSVVVAVPTTSFNVEQGHQFVRNFVENQINIWGEEFNIDISDVDVVINGTGRFVTHGCISDTSLTGRKISVNHPSAGPVWCNKMIGGGSLVKPFHASDFILNVACRYIANVVVASGLANYVVVGVACGIGMSRLQSMFIKCDAPSDVTDRIVEFFMSDKAPFRWTVKGITEYFGILGDNFSMAQCVNDNFFCHPATQPWEEETRIKAASEDLLNYLNEV